MLQQAFYQPAASLCPTLPLAYAISSTDPWQFCMTMLMRHNSAEEHASMAQTTAPDHARSCDRLRVRSLLSWKSWETVHKPGSLCSRLSNLGTPTPGCAARHLCLQPAMGWQSRSSVQPSQPRLQGDEVLSALPGSTQPCLRIRADESTGTQLPRKHTTVLLTDSSAGA